MDRSCEPMDKNRIQGAAEQSERARNRKALVIKAKRRKSGGCAVQTTFVSPRTVPGCSAVWCVSACAASARRVTRALRIPHCWVSEIARCCSAAGLARPGYPMTRLFSQPWRRWPFISRMPAAVTSAGEACTGTGSNRTNITSIGGVLCDVTSAQ